MKKIVLLAVVAAVFGLSYWALNYQTSKTSYENEVSSISISAPDGQSTVELLDSDNDGLLDWEELVWGTDPENPDSDGDGILDGEEIRDNRDPNDAAANDSLTTEAELNLTATQKLSRDILNEFARLQASDPGSANYEEAVSAIIEKNQLPSDYKTYALSDIKTTTENNTSIKAYGNSLGAIMTQNSITGMGDEVTLFNNTLKQNDSSSAKQLKLIAEKHQETVEDMLLVPAPTNAVLLHLKLINAFSAMAESNERMSMVFDDPFIALAGFKQYESAILALSNSFQDISRYLVNSGAQFTVSEPGYIMAYPFGI